MGCHAPPRPNRPRGRMTDEKQAMTHEQEQTEPLVQAWTLARRYRGRLVLTGFAVAVAVLALGLLLPRKYEGEAVFERRTDLVLNEMLSRGASRHLAEPQAVQQDVVSDAAIDRLLERYGDSPAARVAIEAEGGDLNALRRQIRHHSRARQEAVRKDLVRIRVEYISTDPEWTRLVVNGLVEDYIERTQREHEESLTTARDFYSEKVAESEAAFAAAQSERQLFMMRHAAFMLEQPTGLEKTLTDTEQALERLAQEHERAVSRVARLHEQLEQTPETVPMETRQRNPALERLAERRYELEDRLEHKLTKLRMTERHPDVKDLREQIERLSGELHDADEHVVTSTQTVTNPHAQELKLRLNEAKVDRQALARKREAAESRIAQLEALIEASTPIRNRFAELTRRTEQAERRLAYWESPLRAVDLALEAESEAKGMSMAFVRPCEPINRPSSPGFFPILLAAGVFGAGAAGLSVLLAWRTDRTLYDVSQLKQTLGVPLLGTLGPLERRGRRAARCLARAVLYPATATAMIALLIGLSGWLYLDINRPEALERLQQQTRQWLAGDAAAAAELSPAFHGDATAQKD